MRRFQNNKPNYVIFTLSQDISEILLKCPKYYITILIFTSSDDWIAITFFETTSICHTMSLASQLSENKLSPISYHQNYQSIQLGCLFLMFAAG